MSIMTHFTTMRIYTYHSLVSVYFHAIKKYYYCYYYVLYLILLQAYDIYIIIEVIVPRVEVQLSRLLTSASPVPDMKETLLLQLTEHGDDLLRIKVCSERVWCVFRACMACFQSVFRTRLVCVQCVHVVYSERVRACLVCVQFQFVMYKIRFATASM